MKLSINFPLYIRCHPKSKKDPTRFYGSMTQEIEVESISKREAPAILDGITVTEGLNHMWLSPLRTFDGKLYRNIGKPTQDMLSRSYSSTPSKRQFTLANPCLYGNPGGQNLISREIEEWCLWYGAMNGFNTERNRSEWPDYRQLGHPQHLGGFYTFRNGIPFNPSELRDYSAEDLEHFKQMYKSQGERLLMINDELWMETPPPCITAKVYNVDVRDKRPDETHISGCRFDFLTRSHQQDYYVSFPLDMKAEALEHAQEMSDAIKRKFTPRRFLMSDDEFSDPLLQFDFRSELLNRMAFVISTNIVRMSEQFKFHPIYQGKELPWTASDQVMVDQLKQRLIDCNPVLGNPPELGDLYLEIRDLWDRMDRPGFENLGLPAGKWRGFAISTADEFAEDLPVSLGQGLGSSISQKM
jgi:hypothetical protein